MQLALNASIATLQAAASAGSELDDIDALVRTYRPRLLRFVAFSIGDADLAESITQDCFLKAYNARAGFRGDCTISTWLTGIAVNLIRDQQRLRKFRFWRQARITAIDVTDAATFLPSNERSPESLILTREKATQVVAALRHLSANQRAIFLMRFAEDMELSEISAIMKMPVNTVKTHLHRALKSVRSQVGIAQAAVAQAAVAQAGIAQAAPPAGASTSRTSQPSEKYRATGKSPTAGTIRTAGGKQ